VIRIFRFNWHAINAIAEEEIHAAIDRRGHWAQLLACEHHTDGCRDRHHGRYCWSSATEHAFLVHFGG